jgi:hypothetical protein
MDIYKNTGKDIEELVLICNATLPTIGERILTGEETNIKSAFRIYSVYSSSLNLLIGYSSSWNYQRKKLGLLIKNKKKSDKAEKYVQDAKRKFVDLLKESVDQFEVLCGALGELSKIFDNIRDKITTGDNIKTFEDISLFLKEEIKDLRNRSFPNIEFEVKTGGNEKSISWRNQIQNTLNNMTSQNVPYKVLIGGSEGGKYIGGVEAMQIIKQKTVKLHNLNNDIEDGSSNDSKYYEDIFIPTIQNILGVQQLTNEKNILDILLKKVCQSSKDQLQFAIEEYDPQKNLREQITFIIKEALPKLLEYYTKKNGNTSFEIELTDSQYHIRCVGLNIDDNISDDNWSENGLILFKIIKKIIQGIDEEDNRIVEDVIGKEFLQYDKSDQDISDLLSDLEKNFQILTDDGIFPTERHKIKKEYKQLCIGLDDLFETHINDVYNPNLPRVNPCVDATDIQKLEMSKKIRKILDLVTYYLHLENLLIPSYQKLESYFDSIANLLGQIVVVIIEMIDVKNRKTCILRTSLLITTLIRCNMLPVLMEKRNIGDNFNIIKKCQKMGDILLKKFPLEKSDETDKWYCVEQGLCLDMIKKITISYVL